MTSAMEWIGLLVQAGILVVLVDIALHMRHLNAKGGDAFVMRPGDRPFFARGVGHGVPIHHGDRAGLGIGIRYAIWSYRGGSWVLVKPCGQKGCECNTPPSEAGEYEGKVIRKECAPAEEIAA